MCSAFLSVCPPVLCSHPASAFLLMILTFSRVRHGLTKKRRRYANLLVNTPNLKVKSFSILDKRWCAVVWYPNQKCPPELRIAVKHWRIYVSRGGILTNRKHMPQHTHSWSQTHCVIDCSFPMCHPPPCRFIWNEHHDFAPKLSPACLRKIQIIF